MSTLFTSETSSEQSLKWTDRVHIGTSSWSDRSLTHESNWFPKKSMKAAERIAYYAQHFSIVEMETTYRFPPTRAVAEQWVSRTPDNFLFDIQAWSLFTGQPTMRQSLWEDLHNEVREERRDNLRLYDTHLSDNAIDECWSRFRHALEPLAHANKLGSIILRFPRWFSPRDANRDRLHEIRARLDGLPIAVELSNADWVDSQSCEFTFDLLEDLEITFVCTDTSSDSSRFLNGVAATTSPVGIIKLLGRRVFNDDEWTPDWRSYRYSHEELEELAPRLKHLAESCDSLHVLVSTCWKDDAVRNGQQLQEVLNESNQ